VPIIESSPLLYNGARVADSHPAGRRGRDACGKGEDGSTGTEGKGALASLSQTRIDGFFVYSTAALDDQRRSSVTRDNSKLGLFLGDYSYVILTFVCPQLANSYQELLEYVPSNRTSFLPCLYQFSQSRNERLLSSAALCFKGANTDISAAIFPIKNSSQ